MSLPSFPVVNPPIEREDAVNQILYCDGRTRPEPYSQR